RECIAQRRLERAIATQFPNDIFVRPSEFPDPPKIQKASQAIFEQTAIVQWGPDEGDAMPLTKVNDRWKLSMKNWYAGIHSSVGDSLLRSGWAAKAKETTAKEVTDGKYQLASEAYRAVRKHWLENGVDEKDPNNAHVAPPRTSSHSEE